METLMSSLFETIANTERTSLHARYKRRAMVGYVHTLIDGCRLGNRDVEEQKVVREAIVCILRFHEEARERNSGVCLMGKYHNILYVAAKVCYDRELKDTETVAALLDAIYACEGAFDRILVGAIFGCNAPFIFAGWKSDFDDQQQNIAAVLFFLNHATNAACEYNQVRFVDMPLEVCLQMTPLKSAVNLGLPDLVLVLLRFGALVYPKTLEEGKDAMVTILNKLEQVDQSYPYNYINCLQFLLRAIPRIRFPAESKEGINVTLELLNGDYPKVMQNHILPLSRVGLEPPELKHLSRCKVRHQLWLNYQLPGGISSLPLPEDLQIYIDLMQD